MKAISEDEMKKSRRMGVWLSATVLSGAMMVAQGPGRQPRTVLLKLDTDHDGTLSASEIAAASMALSSLDANGDGVLTSLEFLPRQGSGGTSDPEEMVKRLMVFDRNGDGVLTADELPERLIGMMSRADANHDGRLTPEEIRASIKAQTGPAGRQEHGTQVTRMDPILNALDADHDGTISADEIANASASLKTLDLNGDGTLSPDEIRMREATPSDRVNHLLDEWDTNKDGKLSKPECPDRMQEQFEKIDINNDGFLDKAELTTYFVNQPPQRPRETETPH
jgi:Ca2+-binding EF-hand superfamily protein